MAKKGLFITLEGSDGVGKTTHIKQLKNALHRRGHRVLVTREPGGGPASEKIRKLLLDPKTKIQELTELFLYQAARIEHVQTRIQPALKKGRTVLCDRFTDATVAYQGYGRGLSLKQIHQLNEMATGGLKPDLTILLDLPAHLGLKKARARKKARPKGDRLEKEGVSFQKRVRQGYLSLAKKFPRRIKRVAVQNSIEETQKHIQHLVSKKLKK